MGTSSAHGTPTGGNWSDAKADLRDFATSRSTDAAASALANAVQGLQQAPAGRGRGGMGGGGGTRNVITGRGRSALGGGAAFLVDAARTSVQEALERFGILDIEGRDAPEVVDALSAAIVGGRTDLDEQIAVNALRDALLEALGCDVTDFDEALRGYLDQVGIEGFIISFLTKCVVERIWMFLGDGARERIGSEADMQALFDGFAMLCEARVASAVADATSDAAFGSVDWFGPEGVQIIDAVCDELIASLREAA